MPSTVRKTWPSPSTRPQRAASASEAAEETAAGAGAGAAEEDLALGRAANAAGLGAARGAGVGTGDGAGAAGRLGLGSGLCGRFRRGLGGLGSRLLCGRLHRGLGAGSAAPRLPCPRLPCRRLPASRRPYLRQRLHPRQWLPRLRFRWQLLLPMFRRISDCLSPLEVFRLEGNTGTTALRDAAGYFSENESIVTGSAGAPSVAFAPGFSPAAAIFFTTSSPAVTLPTTV